MTKTPSAGMLVPNGGFMTAKPSRFFWTILLALLTACGGVTPLEETPQIVQVVSQASAMDCVLGRTKDFDGSLSVTIALNNLKLSNSTTDLLDPHIINLTIAFKNISSEPLVLKKPISIGISGSSWLLNDLVFILQNEDQDSMSVGDITHYVSGLPYLTTSDFVQLRTKGVFTLPVKMEVPLLIFKGEKSGSKLPAGNYLIWALYRNADIGYTLPMTSTPPYFSDWDSEYNWSIENTMVADLNAWVGMVESNKVEFSIP